MRLVLTASRWGNAYRFYHFVDGVRVSKAFFNSVFHTNKCTPENAIRLTNTISGFRKEWEF